MNAIIIGAGRRGLRLARHLIEEGKSVTLLDNSPSRCANAQSKLDCMAVCGSATNIQMLEDCGAAGADIVVSVTDSDEVNLVSCGIVASRFPNVGTVIATVRGLTYAGDGMQVLGIGHIVNPDEEASEKLADIFMSGLFSDISYFPGAHYFVLTKTVTRSDAFCDKNLIQMKKALPGRYLVAGVSHRGKVMTPGGNTTLRDGDEIAVICDDDESAQLLGHFGVADTNFKLNRITLVGASRICRFLLRKLTPQIRRNVTLVEKDAALCREMAELFPDILVLNGAITDENFWEEEGITRSDLFATLTENDELNVIISSYAKTQGVRRSIALIKTNNNYIKLAKAMGIDAAVSTTEATVDTIMRHIRGGSLKTLHSLFEGRLEAYEYVIRPDFAFLGRALKDVPLSGKLIIGGVGRGDDNFIPDGNYVFREGDTVLVVAMHDQYDMAQELFNPEEAGES